MQLSIIIVNYNVKHFLEQCLCSVQAAMQGLQVEVLVVDNNSSDGSMAYLRPLFPWVHFIANQHNPGFGRANNQAVQLAKGRYVLFLNPDTLLPENALSESIHFMELHPDSGALGIRMIDGSGQFLRESKRAFPSPLTSLFKLSGMAVLFPHSRLFARYHLGHLSADKNHEVDVLAGAYMLVRKAFLDKDGAFDEQFFMYGEDIDLSYRIQKAGWKNYYLANPAIIHFKGESTKKGSLNYVRMFYQAMSVFVEKHYGGSRAGLFRFFIQTAIWLRATVTAAGQFFKWLSWPFRNLYRKITAPGYSNHNKQNRLVIGDEESHAKAIQLLQTKDLNIKAIRHINPNKNETQLHQFLTGSTSTEIIFCINKNFTMQQAIGLMQQEKSALQYKFFYTDSNSIIGSNSKDDSGEVLFVNREA